MIVYSVICSDRNEIFCFSVRANTLQKHCKEQQLHIIFYPKKNPLCSPVAPTLSPQVPHLLIPLASASGIPDGADDPGPSQRVVSQQPRSVGQVMAVRVGSGVRV